MDYHKLRALPQKMTRFFMSHKLAWMGAAAALPLFGIVTTVAVAAGPGNNTEPSITVEQVSERLSLPEFKRTSIDKTPYWREAQMQRGDTLGHVLSRLGIQDGEARKFLYSSPLSKDLLKLKAGATLSVQTNDNGDLFTLRFLNDDENGEQVLVLLEQVNGVWQASADPLPTETIQTIRSASVRTSATGALAQAGVPVEVRAQLADIFADQFDLDALRRDDKINLVYQTLLFNGMPISTGNIEAVEIIKDGVSHQAFYFAFDNESGAYFDAQGLPLKKGFSVQAVKNARISSGYGFRFHPILKRMRMHKGIDYAAGSGTPIYAPSDARVLSVERQSGYGNVVKLAHSQKITTLYAHMSRFATGLRAGQQVKAGDVIGYVGSTGRSTGPHLHMEVMIAGQTVNPSTTTLPARGLSAAQRQSFKRDSSQLAMNLKLLRSLPVNVAQLD
ncbi:M23 family metallopeptidase [Craterilacuibacter sp. RT1T]|nr:M23 family metallopeptidase [Craterilacuibacter sp. RT1T]